MPETPGKEKVLDLLKQIDEGALVIPYFQRDFEWQPGMVCDLVESILQDYFTGLLLFWELDQEEAKNDKWDPVWGAELKNHPKIAILDGQQRLSALYYAIYNPQKTFPNRASYYVFWVDLNKVLSDEIDGSVTYRYYFANHQNWDKLKSGIDKWAETGIVPLSILSASSSNNPEKNFINSKSFNKWCENYILANKDKLPPDITPFDVKEIFDRIADYRFVTFPLKQDRKLHDICNIFARVNSKGMKLSTFDLMNAFLYSKGVHLRKGLWDNLDNESLKNIDSMNEHLLRVISLIKQNYCSSKYLFNLIPGEKTTRKDKYGKKYKDILIENGEDFISLWNKACKFAEKAREKIMNTGECEFGAINRDYIPNATIIPALAAILWRYSEKDDLENIEFNKNLKKWYWSAVLSEDYSGSSDSVIAKDYRDWVSWIEEDTQIERINRITSQFISELNLKEIKKKGSARYNAILCILALNGAADFYTLRPVGSGDYTSGKIHDHHIFPSKVKGLPPEKSTDFKSSKDSIVNRTLLLDKTNIVINNRKPSEYLPEIEAKLGADKIKPIMESHFINENAFRCLKEDDFDGFIMEREKEIKRNLIKVLGIKNK